MNITKADGKIKTTPKISFMPDNGMLYVCKFFIESLQEENDNSKGDTFAVLAFGDIAKKISREYKKGDAIKVKGFFKNFDYYDCNYTRHCTQVLVARQICDSQDSSGVREEECCYKMKEKGYPLMDMYEAELMNCIGF